MSIQSYLCFHIYVDQDKIGWTFSHQEVVVKIEMFVWKKPKVEGEEAGDGRF